MNSSVASGAPAQIAAKSSEYCWKAVMTRVVEVSQSLKRHVIVGGRRILGLLKPSQTPSLQYCKHLFIVSMNCVTAHVRGCWRPNPPDLIDIEVIISACWGSGSEVMAD